MIELNISSCTNSGSATKKEMLDTIDELSSMANLPLLSDTTRSLCNALEQYFENLCSDCFDDSDSDDTKIVLNTSSNVSTFNNYVYTCKFRNALVRRSDIYGQYKALKGSKISLNTAKSCPDLATRERERILSDSSIVDKNGVLLQDVEFSSSSLCACVISGQSTNGKAALKPILW